MRILLLGNTGQLGWELERALATLGAVDGLDYPDIDMAEPSGIVDRIGRTRPQVVVNATAYTAVDRAESESELALAINGKAPGLLAEASAEVKAALVHYSTDYVFDGKSGAPYGEDAATNPLSVYGGTKLAGEEAVARVDDAYLTLRTSWVYSTRRPSFVSKVLGWAREHPSLSIVTDQVSGPTWCRALAEATAQLLAQAGRDPAPWVRERRGLYNLAGDGGASRKEWAEAILELDPRQEEQVTSDVLPALSSDFPTPATRPTHSELCCDRFAETFGLRLPPWREALRLALS